MRRFHRQPEDASTGPDAPDHPSADAPSPPSPRVDGVAERLEELQSLLEEVVEDNTTLVTRLDELVRDRAEQTTDVLREIAALRADLDGALAFRAVRDLCVELIGPLGAIDAMLARADFSDPVTTAGHVRSLSVTLAGVLARMGAEKVRIDIGGELFDPERHRCVGTVAPVDSPFPQVPPRTVVRVLQDGYLLHERPIAPAMVEIQAGASAQDGG
jgi:molecular chaperone GrpE (heat shock protein)